jgi:hypothetical protein
MKKILYILVALPLLFAACNKNNEPEKLPIKEATMTLISNDVETFNAKGGDGVIEFKHTQRFDPNLDEIPTVDVNPFIVSCTAEWVDIERRPMTPLSPLLLLQTQQPRSDQQKLLSRQARSSISRLR